MSAIRSNIVEVDFNRKRRVLSNPAYDELLAKMRDDLKRYQAEEKGYDDEIENLRQQIFCLRKQSETLFRARRITMDQIYNMQERIRELENAL